MVGVWLAHAFACIVAIAATAHYDTPLRRSVQRGQLAPLLAFSFGILVAIGTYLAALLADPGFVHDSDRLPSSMALRDLDEDDDNILLDPTPLLPSAIASDRSASVTTTAIVPPSSPSASSTSSLLSGIPTTPISPMSPSPAEPNPDAPPRDFCRACRVFRPLRARHCITCARCVRRFDHHCPYLGTCVGERNHRWYASMLLTHAVTAMWVVGNLSGTSVAAPDWLTWLTANILFVVACAAATVGMIACVLLLLLHTMLAVYNQTTWEYFSRDRITYLSQIDPDATPFDVGIVRNLRWLLLSQKPRDWESVYCRYLVRVCKAAPSISEAAV